VESNLDSFSQAVMMFQNGHSGGVKEMIATQAGSARVEVERQFARSSIQLLDIDLRAPIESTLYEADAYRLDISLAPRRATTRVRYMQHWAPHRFARIGKVFLLPPGEVMHLRSEAGKDRALVCRLPAAQLLELAGTELTWAEPELEASLDIQSARMASLMLTLADEVAHPGFAGNLVVEAVVLQIGVELLRYRLAMPDAETPDLSSRRLRIIDDRLEKEAAPSLVELATLCGLSVRQLARSFRFSRGVPLGRYVSERRLERAKQRLLQGESVKSVAYTMGFASPSAFCKAFRRVVGQTPAEYKKAVLGGPAAADGLSRSEHHSIGGRAG
jgi:AraC family transcriptional regulator